ncbi:MAG: hypothetical protein SFW36_22730 [Leptolyngbyaceae cyanobacterium bins.59]|nr:hypothetical protein [Leptolyngbyaceae cyanobacterium bins.59]
MEEVNFENKVNQEVTIQGTAHNAVLGAIVMTEDYTPVYLEGFEEWDEDLLEKEMLITGILRYKSIAPNATTSPEGEVSHGIDHESYVIENPSYAFVS